MFLLHRVLYNEPRARHKSATTTTEYVENSVQRGTAINYRPNLRLRLQSSLIKLLLGFLIYLYSDVIAVCPAILFVPTFMYQVSCRSINRSIDTTPLCPLLLHSPRYTLSTWSHFSHVVVVSTVLRPNRVTPRTVRDWTTPRDDWEAQWGVHMYICTSEPPHRVPNALPSYLILVWPSWSLPNPSFAFC